jgi:endonuclease/exonuclease/phosphatase family metal-dependent hydrolase
MSAPLRMDIGKTPDLSDEILGGAFSMDMGDEPVECKVMTFNLRVNVSGDGEHAWPYRIVSASEAIISSGATVIGTQEGTLSMLNDVMDNLPQYNRIGEGREGGDKGEFCAVLYRKDQVRPLQSGTFWLSESPDQPGSKSWDSAFPRICTWVRFEFLQHPGLEFMFYNTHLDHFSQAAREKGAMLICETLAKHRQLYELPAILTGDMNSEPDNPVIQFLRGNSTLGGVRCPVNLSDAYQAPAADSGCTTGCTFHGFTGNTDGQPIDYIFGTSGAVLKHAQVDRKKYGGKFPSDHYPVIATVSF